MFLCIFMRFTLPPIIYVCLFLKTETAKRERGGGAEQHKNEMRFFGELIPTFLRSDHSTIINLALACVRTFRQLKKWQEPEAKGAMGGE